MAFARRSPVEAPFVQANTRRTSAQVGPVGSALYLGSRGLRMPKAMPGTHQLRIPAYSKKDRRPWQAAAIVPSDQPDARLLAKYSSTSRRQTDWRSLWRSPYQHKNLCALKP